MFVWYVCIFEIIYLLYSRMRLTCRWRAYTGVFQLCFRGGHGFHTVGCAVYQNIYFRCNIDDWKLSSHIWRYSDLKSVCYRVLMLQLTTFLRQEPWLDAPPRSSGVARRSISILPQSFRSWQSNHVMFGAELSAVKSVSPVSNQRRLPRRVRRYARAMASQW